MRVLAVVAFLFLLMLVACVAGIFIGTYITLERIPYCSEDVALAGGGQFKNGRYDYYRCGPSFDDWHEHGG